MKHALNHFYICKCSSFSSSNTKSLSVPKTKQIASDNSEPMGWDTAAGSLCPVLTDKLTQNQMFTKWSGISKNVGIRGICDSLTDIYNSQILKCHKPAHSPEASVKWFQIFGADPEILPSTKWNVSTVCNELYTVSFGKILIVVNCWNIMYS